MTFSVSQCLCPPYSLCGWTQTYWISVHPNEFILTLISCKALFQNKATVMGTGHEDLQDILESLFSLKYYSWMTDVSDMELAEVVRSMALECCGN